MLIARWSISRVLFSDLQKDGHSSRIFVTEYLMQPTQATNWKPLLSKILLLLFGLAPSGVYTAANVTARAVRSYRTISTLPKKAVYFLLHFP